MRLLLDTHILVALLNHETHRFDAPFRRLLNDPAVVQCASAASLWEIAIKARLGKLNVGIDPVALPLTLQQFGLQLLPILPEQVVVDLDPVPPTRDPFDRLLLCQCLVESLQLVTFDRALRSHPLAWRDA